MRTRGKKETSADGRETLADISLEGVDKLVRRVNARGSSRRKANGKQVVEDTRVTWNDLDDATKVEVDGGSFHSCMRNSDEEKDDIDWEDGSTSVPDSVNNNLCGDRDESRFMTIEFSDSPDDSSKRKPIRRATAEEKELAELVHKVHLLCLLARGRIIDSACDDPLIQASLLSLLPVQLLKISGVTKLNANILSPLVSWFHNNFHVRSSVSEKRPFQSALAHALETREGTPEEIAALSVALFRALNLTTRFVSILDVASRKPGDDKCESYQGTSKVQRGIFNTSTLMVDRPKEVLLSPAKSRNQENNGCEVSFIDSGKSQCEAQDDISRGSKRKGDVEFEMQLQMALSATAVANRQCSVTSDVRSSISDSSNITPVKKYKITTTKESPPAVFSTAIGSRKIGSPLYWAEVFCSGETSTGRWVHVDSVNAIVDGEQKVEAAAAACRTSLRYVVAFAGHGAKDVTRRYCVKSYKIESQRINSVWWDAVLAPLRELESGATGGMIQLERQHDNASNKDEKIKATFSGKSGSFEGSEVRETKVNEEFSLRNSFVATRSSLEDMEFETRALTEPLPTNQQAYKNHQLYAIERWLTKYQILHPRGPILGFCSGHPVYPRTCVQTLKTKDKWLREGLQVKANDSPAKVLKQSGKIKRVKSSEDNDNGETDDNGTVELFGKWQLEPLQLPYAVNGIVPKNERGQVDVWSEKCLPPGTVHLRLPRVFHVAKRLAIDYAPAMVGFDFKNGRSVPVYDGIVVCTEFKDTILEAYAEEEELRVAEEKRRNEAQAISRWYQLLSSIITRQRLNNCYGNSSLLETPRNSQGTNMKQHVHVGKKPDMQSQQEEKTQNPTQHAASVLVREEGHEHVFLAEDDCFDEESLARTKRCRCGLSIEVEEL